MKKSGNAKNIALFIIGILIVLAGIFGLSSCNSEGTESVSLEPKVEYLFIELNVSGESLEHWIIYRGAPGWAGSSSSYVYFYNEKGDKVLASLDRFKVVSVDGKKRTDFFEYYKETYRIPEEQEPVEVGLPKYEEEGSQSGSEY